ncbi:hypothetical protein ACLOJK_028990 [Asimina triloba]
MVELTDHESKGQEIAFRLMMNFFRKNHLLWGFRIRQLCRQANGEEEERGCPPTQGGADDEEEKTPSERYL